jgi:hypothetical protein
VIGQPVDDLPAAAPRRQVFRAVLRAVLTSTALVLLYFTLPLTGNLDSSTASLLALGLLGLGGVITWQVRTVLRSQYQGLRAIEAWPPLSRCSWCCSRRPMSCSPTPSPRRSASP